MVAQNIDIDKINNSIFQLNEEYSQILRGKDRSRYSLIPKISKQIQELKQKKIDYIINNKLYNSFPISVIYDKREIYSINLLLKDKNGEIESYEILNDSSVDANIYYALIEDGLIHIEGNWTRIKMYTKHNCSISHLSTDIFSNEEWDVQTYEVLGYYDLYMFERQPTILDSINVGETFAIEDFKYTKLEDKVGGCLCIINNVNQSEISLFNAEKVLDAYRYIHSKRLSNGKKARFLTKEEYNKYKSIIPTINHCWYLKPENQLPTFLADETIVDIVLLDGGVFPLNLSSTIIPTVRPVVMLERGITVFKEIIKGDF